MRNVLRLFDIPKQGTLWCPVLVAALCVLAMSTAELGAEAIDQPVGLLTLGNGDTVAGQFRPANAPDSILWQGSHFTKPFEFVLPAVSSIHFPAVTPPARLPGELAIELTSGDMLTGRLVSWNDAELVLDSAHFGLVHVHPAALRRMYRLTDNPLLVYAGLTGLGDWRTHETPWREDGPFIETSADEAMISGDFHIPDKAVIEFEMSWPSKPNFAFVVGADPKLKTDSRRDGWRFEMWDQLLGVLREHKDIADVDRVAMILPSIKRVHLLAYLDQSAGSIQVFLADGTPSGKITVEPTPGAKLGTGLRLINRHGTVRLERLRIAQWNGQIPTAIPAGSVGVQVREGAGFTGQPKGFDAVTRDYLFTVGDEERRVSEQEFVTAEWAPPASLTTRTMATMLQDGTRISGAIAAVESEKIIMECPDVVEPLSLRHSDVRSLVMTERGEEVTPDTPKGRQGRLMLEGRRLTGRLTPGNEDEFNSCLNWHPVASRTASPLKPAVGGQIIYRDPVTLPVPEQTGSAQAQPAQGLNFFGIFMQQAGEPAPARESAAIHNIHLRSGDVIPCKVQSIDDVGVSITSDVTDATFIPHVKIKAIELVKGALPDLKEAKKQRLLTLPRLQKGSPPTHLLCAGSGDFLRCRLLSMDNEKLRVEVQLEELEIVRSRVSHVIWFHPDEQEEEPHGTEVRTEDDMEEVLVAESGQASPIFSNLAQVVQRGGNRVTFDPHAVDETSISGTSDVLGACQFPVAEIDVLSFGGGIKLAVADLVYSPWVLHAALEPLVAQDLGSGPGDTDTGTASPLIGQAAPEIDLELLEGGRFVLSQEKGKVVVLDFWATWCGPCRQSMPLVEALMDQYDPGQTRLIAVNIREQPDEIRKALDLLKLHSEVALDIDEVAARRYQANAIPQLVVVDAEGKVARLFVGGGEQVVAQLKLTLDELLLGTPPAAPEMQ